jgi:hypothetical protein
MELRDATRDDLPAIARFFRAIVAAGETYAYPEGLDDDVPRRSITPGWGASACT